MLSYLLWWEVSPCYPIYGYGRKVPATYCDGRGVSVTTLILMGGESLLLLFLLWWKDSPCRPAYCDGGGVSTYCGGRRVSTYCYPTSCDGRRVPVSLSSVLRGKPLLTYLFWWEEGPCYQPIVTEGFPLTLPTEMNGKSLLTYKFWWQESPWC